MLKVLHLGFGLLVNLAFHLRHHHVFHAKRHAGAGGIVKPRVHQPVRKNDRGFQTQAPIAVVDQAGDGFFIQGLVDQGKRHALGQDAGQQGPPHRRFDPLQSRLPGVIASLRLLLDAHADARMQVNGAALISAVDFVQVRKRLAGALRRRRFARQVIQAQNNILGRHDDRFAIGGRQNVVGGHHQGAGL